MCVCVCVCVGTWLGDLGRLGVLDFPFEHLPSKGLIVGVARCVLGVCRP